jgi:hypothetical protein
VIVVSLAAVLWLLLMKPFFWPDELRTMLGLNSENQTRSKAVVSRVFDVIY